MSDPNPNPNPNPDPPPDKLSLSREDLDKLLKDEYGKGVRHGSNNSDLSKKDRDRLAALEKESSDRVEADRKRKEQEDLERGNFEKARESVIASAREAERKDWEPRLQAAEAKSSKLAEKLKGGIRSAIKAAAGPKAFDADQVADLLERRVALSDDLDHVVLDEHGQPALVAGKPMTIDQLVSGYLDKYPNLVKKQGAELPAGGSRALSHGEQGEAVALKAAIEENEKKFRETGNMDFAIRAQKASTKLKGLGKAS
jgi:hypothetical protein